MRLLKSFNFSRFITSSFVIGALTFFSLLIAAAKDEGTLGNNLFLNFMADSFYIFRFPTHVLFWRFLIDNGWSLFLLGLFINVIFYASLIEVVINFFKNRKQIKLSHNRSEEK
jgi:hypothetical protein